MNPTDITITQLLQLVKGFFIFYCYPLPLPTRITVGHYIGTLRATPDADVLYTVSFSTDKSNVTARRHRAIA